MILRCSGGRHLWNDDMSYTFTGKEEGDYDKIEAIPSHLMPDKDDGIDYSDEIVEMKSKVTLAAKLPAPSELFKDDRSSGGKRSHSRSLPNS